MPKIGDTKFGDHDDVIMSPSLALAVLAELENKPYIWIWDKGCGFVDGSDTVRMKPGWWNYGKLDVEELRSNYQAMGVI